MNATPRNLDVVQGFPVVAYAEVEAILNAAFDPKPEAYWDFTGGWIALAYRTIAAWEYDRTFRMSIAQDDAPPEPGRYEQERNLYGFFASGLSAIESASYALFAMGTMLSPANFALVSDDHRRQVNPAATLAAYRRWMPRTDARDALANALHAVVESDEFTKMSTARNVLLHRTAPGRNIQLQVGSTRGRTGSTWKLDDAPLNSVTLIGRDWLLVAVRILVEAAEQFAQGHFPPIATQLVES